MREILREISKSLQRRRKLREHVGCKVEENGKDFKRVSV
jgi:hypothetical protein